MLDMPDRRPLLSFGPDDCDDIKPHRRRVATEARQVNIRSMPNASFLERMHLLLGRDVLAAAGFDLNKDEPLAVAGDEVDFPSVAAPVGGKNPVPLAL